MLYFWVIRTLLELLWLQWVSDSRDGEKALQVSGIFPKRQGFSFGSLQLGTQWSKQASHGCDCFSVQLGSGRDGLQLQIKWEVPYFLDPIPAHTPTLTQPKRLLKRAVLWENRLLPRNKNDGERNWARKGGRRGEGRKRVEFNAIAISIHKYLLKKKKNFT